jgi:hypothetical protein
MEGRSDGVTRPDSYYNNNNNNTNPGDNAGPSSGYYPNRARYPRTASEPHFNSGGQGVYPVSGIQQSYETVNTASGSGSSGDPAGYFTDPSSENSSVDRVAPPQKDPAETYGFNGFGNAPQYLPPGNGINEQYGWNGAQQQGGGYHHQGPPPVPRKEPASARGPIRLGASNANVITKDARPPTEKRKSWFGKRFSKNA